MSKEAYKKATGREALDNIFKYVEWLENELHTRPNDAKKDNVSENGWVLENGAGGDRLLQYRTMDDNGCISWTPDIETALQFRRRADAERFCKEDDDAWGITEHSWPIL